MHKVDIVAVILLIIFNFSQLSIILFNWAPLSNGERCVKTDQTRLLDSLQQGALGRADARGKRCQPGDSDDGAITDDDELTVLLKCLRHFVSKYILLCCGGRGSLCAFYFLSPALSRQLGLSRQAWLDDTVLSPNFIQNIFSSKHENE